MSELNPRQKNAVLAVITAKTMDEAASQAGVDIKTLWRWRKNPLFVAAVDAARRDLMTKAADHLRLGAVEAVAALRRVLADKETAAPVVVQAASAILSHAIKVVELSDVTARLDALEAKADEPQRY